MKKQQLEILKQAVKYNMQFWKVGEIDELFTVYSERYEQEIWNPFRDFANNPIEDPVEEYGLEFIEKYIAEFEKLAR